MEFNRNASINSNETSEPDTCTHTEESFQEESRILNDILVYACYFLGCIQLVQPDEKAGWTGYRNDCKTWGRRGREASCRN